MSEINEAFKHLKAGQARCWIVQTNDIILYNGEEPVCNSQESWTYIDSGKAISEICPGGVKSTSTTLLNAAFKCFLAQGYKGTTIEELGNMEG
jgi:hypothetical protein